MDDKKAIELCLSGNEAGFRFLYEKYAKNLINFINSFLHSKEDSEEVLQEVFLRFFKSIKRVNPDVDGVYPYLKKIALNKVYDKLKKRKREKEKVEYYIKNHNSSSEDNSFFYEIVSKLPERQRIVLILKKIEGYSIKELSKELGISEKAVESLISRAVKNISKLAKDYFNKEGNK